MSPDPHRRPPRLRRAAAPALTALALLGAGAALPAVAHAAAPVAPSAKPKPNEAELKKQLKDLNDQAETLTEKFNKARVEYGKAVKAQKDAEANSARLEAQVAPARAQLSRLAAQTYMGGNPNIMFGAGSDMSGLSDTAYLQQNQAAIVSQVQGQIDRANKAAADAKAKAAQVQKALQQVRSSRDAAKAKVAEVQKQLDKLNITTVTDPNSGIKIKIQGSGLPARMVRKALTKRGSAYVWGAAGPTTFDCSGLVVWAYAQVGKPGLPHYTGDLYQLGTHVSRGALKSGDLVYFGGNLHHMGIYLGSGYFLHAPQTGDVVKISKLSDRSDFAGANRIS
ncbi:C40 family peptidase [Actinomadura parmotrematis]|uniref:C40 family peptidase n=1 Tax=Actinomadura parmotrematis TaxID=2864039 RepID=A0ABS7FM77_9ACTN|nr:C40 family peptidase [Actinomadura parmotrematis]MBW8481488.1 C40 family peptidase [Actinomadura parmotrematis]